MSSHHRARATLIGAGAIISLTFAGASAAFAAPYTDDPTLSVSTTNPAVGGSLTLTLANFGASEPITIRIDGSALATFTADANGDASGPVTLPAGLKCTHTLSGTGQSSGDFASSSILIGPAADCPETSGGNLGTGNSGAGNMGDNNVGHGNTGNNNTGSGNTGNNNTGYGNTVDGNTGSGNTPYMPHYGNEGYGAGPDDPFTTTSFSTSTPVTDDAVGPVGVAALVGMATVGGIGFARRRRATP